MTDEKKELLTTDEMRQATCDQLGKLADEWKRRAEFAEHDAMAWKTSMYHGNAERDALAAQLEGARRHLDPLRAKLAVTSTALTHLLAHFKQYGEMSVEQDRAVIVEAEKALAMDE